jgi:hypothetical protein
METEKRTQSFFVEWNRVTAGLTLEEKGAYAEVCAAAIGTRKAISDEVAVGILGTTMRKWSRLKTKFVAIGALAQADDGVIVPALRGRIHRTGYLHIKDVIPEQLRWAVFQRDNYRCCECGSGERLTADHIDPEINGGETALHNLQTLCRPCNSRKGAKP